MIRWLVGQRGARTSAAVARARADAAIVIDLGAWNADRCLWELARARGRKVARPLTSAQLLAIVDEAPRVVIDALDDLQDDERILDARLRDVMRSFAAGRWLDGQLVVASQRMPPASLREAVRIEVTAAPVGGATDGAPPRMRSRSRDLALAIAACGANRHALPGWLLGMLAKIPVETLDTPSEIAALADDGALVCVGNGPSGDWFTAPRAPREAIPHHAIARVLVGDDVRRLAALAGDDAPQLLRDLGERAIDHLLRAGATQDALVVYWRIIGNYAQLARDGAWYAGLRMCRALAGERAPAELAPGFAAADGATSVLNDWSLFAVSLGEGHAALAAAQAAPRVAQGSMSPDQRAQLATQEAGAWRIAGDLERASACARTAADYARRARGAFQGIPTVESMEAVDNAALEHVEILACKRDANGLADALDELVDTHARARDLLASVNLSSILAVGGPTAAVDPEMLVHGRPAALLAIARGEADDARRILANALTAEGVPWRLAMFQALALARLHVDAGARNDADELIDRLRTAVASRDDAEMLCGLALIEGECALCDGDAARGAAIAAEHMALAKDRGLALLAAEHRALGARARGEPVPVLPTPLSRSRAERRRYQPRPASRAQGAARRLELHNAAMNALADCDATGAPLALYLRKFDVTVAHGPPEDGPSLLENILFAAMPAGAHLVTIQCHGADAEYAGNLTAFDRDAPALFLPNEEWDRVPAALIPRADLVVSECLMLSGGVRTELEQAYAARRWDRTVLVLPPVDGPFAPIDSEAIIQMFPRGIWANALKTESFVDSPVIADLLARMGAITALPAAERLALRDPVARDRAFPIDLMLLAKHYEFDAQLRSLQQDTDPRARYEGFWTMFRASAIRGEALLRGDDSDSNRMRMADLYLQMAAIMFDHERDDDCRVLVGDLAFAEQCATSAYHLVRGEGWYQNRMRARAAETLEQVDQVRRALAEHPERLVARPRYGPFRVASRKVDG